MANRLIQRHDTAANWSRYNPILAEGELGFVTDQSNRYKIGDGITAWNNLPLQGFNGNVVNELGNDEGSVLSQKFATEKLTELESEINKIPHPNFANNVPYITELYVTDVGKEMGVGMILIVQNTDSSRLVSFATKDGSAYAGITNKIEGTNILKIVDRGNPTASPIYGYVLVDWTQIEGLVSPQQQITDAAYSLDNSPSIKSYILENAIKEDIKQSENSTKEELKKIESKIDGKADYTPIVYSNNIWDNNLINQCIANGTYELGKYIAQNGTFSDAPAQFAEIFACSDYIEIKEGDVIVGRLVYLDEAKQFSIGAFYDADKNLLSSFYNSQISSKSYTLIAPKNAAYIRFTLFTNVMQNYICINPNVVTPHSAKGKKINYLGDSITLGAYTDGVAQRYTNVVATMTESESINLGVSGTLIGGNSSAAFCNRLYTLDLEADALIVFGGTNDYWTANALGEIKSTNKEETCGAVNYIIDYWQTNCPKKPIAFILPFNQYFKSKDCEWNNGYGTLQDYCNAIKSVCERKGVPVLNLYSESGMNMAFNETQRTLYSADGVHPNMNGHYVIARKVADFLSKLFA
jgi:lysophospholipase L1-like esterase